MKRYFIIYNKFIVNSVGNSSFTKASKSKMSAKMIVIISIVVFIATINSVHCNAIPVDAIEASEEINELSELIDIPSREEDIRGCRRACVKRFLIDAGDLVSSSSCNKKGSCLMCWDFCEFLNYERGSFRAMCGNFTCVSIYLQLAYFQ